jgi:hypothetical protein
VSEEEEEREATDTSCVSCWDNERLPVMIIRLFIGNPTASFLSVGPFFFSNPTESIFFFFFSTFFYLFARFLFFKYQPTEEEEKTFSLFLNLFKE